MDEISQGYKMNLKETELLLNCYKQYEKELKQELKIENMLDYYWFKSTIESNQSWLLAFTNKQGQFFKFGFADQ